MMAAKEAAKKKLERADADIIARYGADDDDFGGEAAAGTMRTSNNLGEISRDTSSNPTRHANVRSCSDRTAGGAPERA